MFFFLKREREQKQNIPFCQNKIYQISEGIWSKNFISVLKSNKIKFLDFEQNFFLFCPGFFFSQRLIYFFCIIKVWSL